MVEHRTENPGVGSSISPLSTRKAVIRRGLRLFLCSDREGKAPAEPQAVIRNRSGPLGSAGASPSRFCPSGSAGASPSRFVKPARNHARPNCRLHHPLETVWGGGAGQFPIVSRGTLDLLDVPRPEPTRQDDADNSYVFEKRVDLPTATAPPTGAASTSTNAAGFVLEIEAGQRNAKTPKTNRRSPRNCVPAARNRHRPAWHAGLGLGDGQGPQPGQALREAIPDEWPPFLIVCDVGHCIDLYADFARTGKNYLPFPTRRTTACGSTNCRPRPPRAAAAGLDRPDGLDPGRRSAQVTRELAAKLAELAKRLERGHTPDEVAGS